MVRPGPVADTVRRHWSLLRLVPRAPRQIEAARLEDLLAQEGIEITRRSVQRDLEHLAAAFPGLKCNRKSKPYGWSWSDEAPLLEIPAMGLASAVTFELLRRYLSLALPRTTLRTLEPHFSRAHDALASHTTAKLARWPSKVRVLPRGYPLTAPDVPRNVLEVVYAALLDDRRFTARYRGRGASTAKEYLVNPLGLVLRDGTMALVASCWDYDDVVHLLLHRMTRAELTTEPVRKPKGFNLDEHLEKGAAGFIRGAPIVLVAVITNHVAITISEAPLSADQKITPIDGEHSRVTATVSNTMDLRGWIQSYGANIEVERPAALRKEMAEGARQLLAKYRKRKQ
jgi:predicted DNA-binding transcriptional regulator YafY